MGAHWRPTLSAPVSVYTHFLKLQTLIRTSSALLAYKVSKSNSLLGDSTVKRHLCHGLRTIVDAGLIYSAMLIVALVFVATKVNAFWIAEFIVSYILPFIAATIQSYYISLSRLLTSTFS